MHKQVLLLLPLFLLSFPPSACTDSEDADTSTEYPEVSFDFITLRRTSGYGFCPSSGSALASQIYRDNGNWIIEATVLEPAPEGTDSSLCLENFGRNVCLVAIEKPIAILSDSEIEMLASAIDAVPAKQCEIDEGLACDPCLLTEVKVDNSNLSRACCGTQNAEFTAGFDQLTAVIDSLSK
jgi:hypothetical protein